MAKVFINGKPLSTHLFEDLNKPEAKSSREFNNFHFQDSYWGDDHSYPYAHQYTNEQSAYIYDINNDNEYNQYHYAQQYKGDEEYSSYNYEKEVHGSSQHDNENNSSEHEETNEGLLCEEDETDTLFDDGLEQ